MQEGRGEDGGGDLDAVEKFVEAMNKISLFWEKEIRVVAKKGRITLVECEGFTFISDPEEENLSGEKIFKKESIV